MISNKRVRRWRETNPERKKEQDRINTVRYKARKAGRDVEAEVSEYLRRRDRRQYIKANPSTEKLCTKCGESKTVEQFESRSASVDGRDSNCRDCKNKTRKLWAKRNRSRLAAAARVRYAESEKIKAATSNRSHRWKKNNPDRWSHQKKAQSVRRRSNLTSVRVDLTEAQWTAIKIIYGYRCAYCGKRKPLTQDHIIPVSKGGEHTASNIVPACQSCNSSKSAGQPKVSFQQHLLA